MNKNSVEIIKRYFTLTPKQEEQYSKLLELYSDWNSKINVISRKDIDENFYPRHVLHSLAIAKSGMLKSGQHVLDLGCGGGFPVIPLAIMYPEIKFVAVDSIGKKIKVVSAVVEALGLENVEIHNCRVESLPGSWDWVVSRAVAPLADLSSWVKGRYRYGMLLLKGGDLELEIEQSGVKRSLVAVDRISEMFEDEFFETKVLVRVRK